MIPGIGNPKTLMDIRSDVGCRLTHKFAVKSRPVLRPTMTVQSYKSLKNMEASRRIELLYTDLQSAA